MTIKTQQSISGFIVGNLKLEHTRSGDAKLTARVGQDRFERLDDGDFKRLDPEYFDIVQFRKAAERTFQAFKPGDRFVAEGYVHEYEYENRAGETVPGEEFVVKKIGHDTARTHYNVQRTPHRNSPEAGQDGPTQTADQSEATIDGPELDDAPPQRAQTAGAVESAPPEVDPGPERRLAYIPSNGVSSRPEMAGASAELSR
ncbi:single-stranded DNA-binding protein [Microbacterium sp. NPDC056234]|uniref:single-stranded DNA-binding protein n=1 Tax=Microbacterium sp. NPDC056234 TaxID=3345757 RepID=UPI0035DB5D74